MNFLLNDPQRKFYGKAIMELFSLCPEMMSRKIDRANVQQGFMLDTVRSFANKNSSVLCVGSYEDTACEALIKLGYNITAIDPQINMSLGQYISEKPDLFDIVFSTSVIEHVEDDETFLDQMCKLLQPSGVGILTCDFNDGYGKVETPKPSEDFRLYTKEDLLGRFNNILIKNNCEIIGGVNYNGAPDFHYNGCVYTFATYCFRKKL